MADTTVVTSKDDCQVTRVNTREMINDLGTLFKKVVSGEAYNKDQIKSATSASNAIMKIAKHEFDVFKYFDSRMPSQPTLKTVEEQ